MMSSFSAGDQGSKASSCCNICRATKRLSIFEAFGYAQKEDMAAPAENPLFKKSQIVRSGFLEKQSESRSSHTYPGIISWVLDSFLILDFCFSRWRTSTDRC